MCHAHSVQKEDKHNHRGTEHRADGVCGTRRTTLSRHAFSAHATTAGAQRRLSSDRTELAASSAEDVPRVSVHHLIPGDPNPGNQRPIVAFRTGRGRIVGHCCELGQHCEPCADAPPVRLSLRGVSRRVCTTLNHFEVPECSIDATFPDRTRMRSRLSAF